MTKIDFKTIMFLRGDSITNSFICLNYSECVQYGSRVMALASILQVMLEWNWNEIAQRFIELMRTDNESEMDEMALQE